MRAARLGEWLKSMEGLVVALSMATAALASIYASIQGKLAPAAEFFGLEGGSARAVAQVGALAILLPVLWLGVSSYRSFARASRLEQPDRFSLSVSEPEDLIGRKEDLTKLQDAVSRNRVVLLDGESGSGKSALIAVGLVPRLLRSNGLLPVLVSDWGADWERGPLSAALGAFFDVLTPQQRDSLGIAKSPDLAADAHSLAGELGRVIGTAVERLGLRPLLIADQFDDYQARHRERFIDAEGNWLRPDTLAVSNPFWGLVRAHLQAGTMHLLAVTRADTASGISCVRFLEASLTADRHLPRVDLEYLRPLLEKVAPADAVPSVVSQPDQGWYELRDRIEADLQIEGSVLMQQVRTVLMGLRQLPVLTVAAYRRAGELRGVESLVIARAVRRAGSTAGDGLVGQRLARSVLAGLVLPGGAKQPAKAKRASFAAIAQVVGDDSKARKLLETLQAEEVVRPAGDLADGSAWQLDHDYMAHAVLAEAKQADKWGISLHEGLKRYQIAGNLWRRRWAALLPSGLQARLAWEWFRGRLRYGEAAPYARLSLLKPAVTILMLGTAFTAASIWREDRLHTLEATRIYDRFGGRNEEFAVLDAWRASGPVRDRLYRLVQEDESRLDRATRSAWPSAHGGLEHSSLLQSIRLLSHRLAHEPNSDVASEVAQAYTYLVAKLMDSGAIHQSAIDLRARMAHEKNTTIALDLNQAYATVAQRITSPDAIQQEVASLRERLEHETNLDIASRLGQVYTAMISRIEDPSAIQREAVALHERLASEPNVIIASNLAQAYAAVVAKHPSPSAASQASVALQTRLESEANPFFAPVFAQAFASVAARLSDSAAIQEAAAALRQRLARASNPIFVPSLAQAYSTVVAKLADPAAVEREAELLRQWQVRESSSQVASELALAYAKVVTASANQSLIQRSAALLRAKLAASTNYQVSAKFVEAYTTVASKLAHSSAIQQEVFALQERMAREDDPRVASSLAQASAAMAARLTNSDAILPTVIWLRERLVRETDRFLVLNLAHAYSAVVGKIDDSAAVGAEAAELRSWLVRETNPELASALADAYVAVARKLVDTRAIQQEVVALRKRLEGETNSDIILSLARAYGAVATRLSHSVEIHEEVVSLRMLLKRKADSGAAAYVALAYASVAAKQANAADVQEAAATLRERLLREAGYIGAPTFAKAYATIAREVVAGAVQARNEPLTKEFVAQVLTMTGHPYVVDAAPLLFAVEPAARRNFGSDVGAAVEWWVKDLGGDAATLRP